MEKTVNNNAKEAVDTIDYVIQWFVNLWDSSPMELKAFVLSVFVISILMEWVKKALLANKPKRERINMLWMSSLPLGLILSGVGYAIADGVIHLGYWIVIGLTSGSTAMGVHFITIKVMWPAMQVIASAVWARVMLMVRGAPRND